jgi:hypothetical protein
MNAKLATPLLFFVSVGCATRPVTLVAGASSRASAPERRALATQPALAPAPMSPNARLPEPSAKAPRQAVSPLELAGGSLDDERQIAALKQAIALYTQFLERAQGRPELEPAVLKSRQRIEDARATIVFLEAGLEARRSGGSH